MINFVNDYSTICAPEILKAMEKINGNAFSGYGTDDICAEAKKILVFEMEREDADIHFVEGGTQANLILIGSALRSYQGVIATDYSHIAQHETGAIEATGHKVITVPHHNGKLDLMAVKKVLNDHSDEHMVQPKMLYISQTTELGSVYSKDELAGIYGFAKENDLFLYIDGARLGSALTSDVADFSMADIANSCDAFTIGGTKNGMFMGEAMVIINPLLKEDFRYGIKQRGGLMAKGWLLGLGFRELFHDGLFYRLAEHANLQGAKVRRCLKENDIPLFSDAVSNQIFPIFTLEQIMKLSEDIGFEIIEKVGKDKAVIRFVTSYATTDADVAILTSLIQRITIE